MRDQLKKDYAIKNGYNFLEIWFFEKEKIDCILEEKLKKILEKEV